MSRPQRAWKTTEVETLRRMYPDTETAEVAKLLGRSLKSVYYYAAWIGLRKSSRFLHRPRGSK